MNLLFQTRKPRRFQHRMIYVDERQERLAEIKRRAQLELGMKPDLETNKTLSTPSDGALRNYALSPSRRHRPSPFSNNAFLALLIIVLVFFWMLIL